MKNQNFNTPYCPTVEVGTAQLASGKVGPNHPRRASPTIKAVSTQLLRQGLLN